jgi:hypothetical protein
MSYDAVARAVVRVAAENGEVLRTSKSAVAHWVAGAEPSGRTGIYLAEVISRRSGHPVTVRQPGFATEPVPELAGAEPIKTATLLGQADREHNGFLAAAVYTASDVRAPLDYDPEPVSRLLRARIGQARAGIEEVTVVRNVTRAFGAADEVLGGGHGLSSGAAYLTDAAIPRGYPLDEANRDTIRSWLHSMRTIGAGPWVADLAVIDGRSPGRVLVAAAKHAAGRLFRVLGQVWV